MPKRADLSTRLSYALAWVRGRADGVPAAGIVLGSGLAGLADRLERATVIPYEEIPGFPISKVPGHRARLVLGELPVEGGAIPVAAMQGRAHGYEGWSADDVAFGARVLCGLGVKLLLVTNAAGGVNPSLVPGDLVRITDHLNLSGLNPLVGENDDRLGPRFPDLTDAYDPRLGVLLDEAAAERGIALRAGRVRVLARSVVRDAGGGPDAPRARRGRGRDVDRPGGRSPRATWGSRSPGSRSSRTSRRGSRARRSRTRRSPRPGGGSRSGSPPS